VEIGTQFQSLREENLKKGETITNCQEAKKGHTCFDDLASKVAWIN